MIKRIFAPVLALKGNPRYAVFTEPLWGVPHTLYAPFFALYMGALGLLDGDIGIVISVGLVVQMISSVLSGVITDKYGRRLTNIIWDHLAWTVPCLIWAFAQDFRWFVVAAAFNGLWPIGANAWECLLVEDAEPNKIVQLFNWIYIAGLLAVFIAPLSGFLIGVFGLVDVMRVLFIFAAISMSAKFIVHYIYATETGQGVVKLKETRNVPLWKLLAGYSGVIKQIFTTPATVRVLVLTIILHIQLVVANNFYPLYVTQDLGLPEQILPWLNVVLRGAIMLLFFLVFQRILDKFPLYLVMIAGLILYFGGYVLLITIPAGFIVPLIIFTAIDACAAALVMPRRDSLVINNVNPAERARIRALMMAIMLGAASPFGFIIGRLSDIDRRIPFTVCLVVFVVVSIIVMFERKRKEVQHETA